MYIFDTILKNLVALYQDNLGRLYKVVDADVTICSFGGMFSVETFPS